MPWGWQRVGLYDWVRVQLEAHHHVHAEPASKSCAPGVAMQALPMRDMVAIATLTDSLCAGSKPGRMYVPDTPTQHAAPRLRNLCRWQNFAWW